MNRNKLTARGGAWVTVGEYSGHLGRGGRCLTPAERRRAERVLRRWRGAGRVEVQAVEVAGRRVNAYPEWAVRLA